MGENASFRHSELLSLLLTNLAPQNKPPRSDLNGTQANFQARAFTKQNENLGQQLGRPSPVVCNSPTAEDRMRRRSRLQIIAVYFLAIGALVGFVSACAPAPKAQQFHEQSNKTGYKDPTGRSHTGAGDDSTLNRLKAELAPEATGPESLEKEDRELAAQILGARIEESQNRVRVLLNLRDVGRLTFDFLPSDVASAGTEKNPDVRYKAVLGKSNSGDPSSFEVALLCRQLAPNSTKPESTNSLKCGTATMSLKERHGSKAKAGLILRNQEVSILVRPGKQEKLENENLKRLANDFKTIRYGRLQSFEVAWGPSGFDLEMGDAAICPSGRLVETNDLDEPLKLHCREKEPFRDLEGRMIGNTTRGELFFEISATVPGIIPLLPEGNERIFILVRQKKMPKSNGPKPTDPKPSGTPSAGTPQTPAGPATSASEEDDEDEFFLDDQSPLVPAPQSGSVPQSGNQTGWLVPIDLNDSVTKSWARDRKNPLVAKKVKEWQESRRFKAFAGNYIHNRDTVIKGLKASKVPAEFSFITLIESTFFIEEGYPVQVSSAKAVGPWQFMPSTATDSRFGLKIEPLIPVTNEKGKVTSYMASPCDDRADLAKSSEAAGKYFRVLLNMFPRDPKLAIAAYNWGEGNVECLASTSKKCQSRTRRHSQERLNEIRELGLSFWAIHRYNMAPSSTLNYVIDFVAAHHAALEMEPLKAEKSVAPWRPAPQCARR